MQSHFITSTLLFFHSTLLSYMKISKLKDMAYFVSSHLELVDSYQQNGLQMIINLFFETLLPGNNNQGFCSPIIICKFKTSLKTLMSRSCCKSVISIAAVRQYDSSDFESGPQRSQDDLDSHSGNVLLV